MKPDVVLIDFETQCALDLSQVGGRVYSQHDSTKVICCGFLHKNDKMVWVPEPFDRGLPKRLEDGTPIDTVIPDEWLDRCKTYGVCAHNASLFDRYIWDRFVALPVSWVDTVNYARQFGLPASLEKLSERLTGEKKDAGKSVLKRVMTSVWDGKRWTNKYALPGAILAIVRYCVKDLYLLKSVYDYLRQYTNTDERAIQFNEIVNAKGVEYDESLAATISEISNRIIQDSVHRIHEIAPELRGVSLRSIPKMREWLKQKNVVLHNLRRETVEHFIANPDDYINPEGREGDDELGQTHELNVPKTVIEVLKLRNASLRVTGAKLERASAVCEQGRIYDMFVYHAAHTGRFSSRLVQVHNLPRGVPGLDTVALADNLSYETVMQESCRLGVPPDDILSSLIRPCFRAKAGHQLIISDYSSIETRVVSWIANDKPFLTGFQENPDYDPYKDMASIIFDVPKEKVQKWQRQAAKPLVLGGVYGLGPKRLVLYAESLGVDLKGLGLSAETLIEAFRDAHPAIAGDVRDIRPDGRKIRSGGLWNKLIRAFYDCYRYNFVSDVGRCRIYPSDNHTICVRLPSNRVMYYREVREEQVPSPWGEGTIPALSYDAGRGRHYLSGGLITENIVQAVSRDLLVEHGMQLLQTGIDIVLHVHDEIVCEVPENNADECLRKCMNIMETPPQWATGLPLKAEGHVSWRYCK